MLKNNNSSSKNKIKRLKEIQFIATSIKIIKLIIKFINKEVGNKINFEFKETGHRLTILKCFKIKI
jgi:hypothetical protein